MIQKLVIGNNEAGVKSELRSLQEEKQLGTLSSQNEYEVQQLNNRLDALKKLDKELFEPEFKLMNSQMQDLINSQKKQQSESSSAVSRSEVHNLSPEIEEKSKPEN